MDTTSFPLGRTNHPSDQVSTPPTAFHLAHYNVYRQTSGTASTLIASPTTTSYTDNGLLNGTAYTYEVTAVSTSGVETAPSNTSSATPSAPAPGPCGSTTSAPATYDHIVWILMENHSYNEIINNSTAPYINNLAKQCGLATNYFAITHPSLPNYLALTAGDFFGIADDNPPSSHPLNVPNIFAQLPAGGSRSLEESMTSNCQQTSSGEYAVKHNPEAYFTNVGGATTPPTGDCANFNIGYTAFGTPDISAKFTFVTPNLISDMHDGTIQQGDTWLSNFVPLITGSATYAAGKTAIVITWDEDDSTQSNQVATIVIAPSVRPGTQSNTRFNHYSLLGTTEDQLGLPRIANAVGAGSMRSAFNY